MYKYAQKDINLLASHINSTARNSLNGATPFNLAELPIDKKIPLLTGQHGKTAQNRKYNPNSFETRIYFFIWPKFNDLRNFL